MSWLKTVWDVGVDLSLLSGQMSTTTRLESFRQQNEQAGMVANVGYRMHQYLQIQIFAFRNAIEELLILEPVTTFKMSAALMFLEKLFEGSGIKPELFPELYEKEYVAATYRIIRINRRYYWKQIIDQDQKAIYEFVTQVFNSNNEEHTENLMHKFFEDSALVNLILIRPLGFDIFTELQTKVPEVEKTETSVSNFTLCSKCGAENTNNRWICIRCGGKLDKPNSTITQQSETRATPSVSIKRGNSLSVKTCPRCKEQNSSSKRYCTNCGAKL